MKTKSLLLLIGIFMSHYIGYAQITGTVKKKEYKFGRIAPEEFQLKASGKDSASAAVKIFDIGNCYFEIGNTSGGFIYVFERHIRYKILSKAGYDLANYKIGLFRSGNGAKEELYSMDAATYNMVDGKMITSKISRDAKFSEEFNKNYTYRKFALPNVKEGSIIEFKYTIKSDFIFNLRGWNFQSEVPTLHTEYNVRIPTYFRYKANFSGYMKVDHSKHLEENVNLASGLVAATAMYDQYSLDDVPALKDEAYITTLDDYRPSVDFELMSTQFPGEIYKDYTGTWPKIVRSLTEDENFGLFVNKNSYAKSVLPTILKGEKDTLAMTKLIFNYVKNNIKWDESYNIYATGTNPKTIVEKKSGSSGDVNLTLINLLREAKLNALPVLLSTRDNGLHPGFPNISKFNNVIAYLIIDNKPIFLDATNKDMPLGMVAYENLNHEGYLVDVQGFKGRWITTEPTFNHEKNYTYSLVLDKENKLKGTVNQYTRGYAALDFRNKYRNAINEGEFLKDFKKNKSGLELVNYKVTNLNDLDELLTESMEVVIEDNVEEAGNLVYLTPLLYERTKENLFKHEERHFPVDFGSPQKESYRITITFPDDYEIDKLPKSAIYKIPNDKGSFTITYATEGKTLLVKSTIEIKKTFYEPEEYFDLKELFKNIVQKQAEQIVFKKKS